MGVSVNASDGHHGESYWWVHPADSNGRTGRTLTELRQKAAEMRENSVKAFDGASRRTTAQLRAKAVDMRAREVSTLGASGRSKGSGEIAAGSENGEWFGARPGLDNS